MAWKLFSGLLLLAICCNLALAVDQTRVDKASGFDVTDATIDLIHNSQVFTDDSNFLMRVAYVETHYGTDAGSFNTSQYRGIWRLNQERFNLTKSSSLLTAKHAAINTAFRINWANTTWDQLNTPLYGGLAARLFIETLPPIPQTKAEQASYWLRYYTQLDKTEEYFRNETDKLEDEAPPCEGKMDMVVVLDGSGSVGDKEFDKAKAFVANLLDTFSNDTNFVRKAFIVFSATSTTLFNLTSGLNATQMRDTVVHAGYPGQGTETNAAILAAVRLFENAPNRTGVPRVMTLFTDGQSNSGVSNIERARQASITPFAIGIGNAVQKELLQIALNDASRVYNVNNFDALTEFFRRLNDDTCKVPQQPGNETTADTLGKNQKRYYKYTIPQQGLTIRLGTSTGSINGYYSYSYTKPSAALYDGRLSSATYIAPRTNATQVVGIAADTETDGVYLSITGTADSNKYVIEALEGNQVPASSLIAVPMLACIALSVIFNVFK
jgi:collagen type VI alpha